jgi:hypothetical protein
MPRILKSPKMRAFLVSFWAKINDLKLVVVGYKKVALIGR